MSLCPRRQPVPWLSSAKRASAHPSESAKGDPSRDTSAVGAFRVIVQFGQQYAERVPLPCKKKKKEKRQEPQHRPWPCERCPGFDQPLSERAAKLQDPAIPISWRGGDIMLGRTELRSAAFGVSEGCKGLALSEQWVGVSSCYPFSLPLPSCCPHTHPTSAVCWRTPSCPGLSLCTSSEAIESGLGDPASSLGDGDGRRTVLCPQTYSAEQSPTIVHGVGVQVWTSLSDPPSPSPATGAEQDPFRSAQETQALILLGGDGSHCMSESRACSIFSPHSLVPRRAGDAGPCPTCSGRSAGPVPPRDGGHRPVPVPDHHQGSDCEPSPADSPSSNSVRAPSAGGRMCPAFHLWEPVFMEAKCLESPKLYLSGQSMCAMDAL